MNTDDIKAVAALEVNRRKLLQGLGVAAGATALGLSPSDPVYAASVGYDLKHGADGEPLHAAGRFGAEVECQGHGVGVDRWEPGQGDGLERRDLGFRRAVSAGMGVLSRPQSFCSETTSPSNGVPRVYPPRSLQLRARWRWAGTWL